MKLDNMNDTNNRVLLALGVIAFLLVVILFTINKPPAGTFGEATSGLPATVATSSLQNLPAATAQRITGTSTTCTARVISTTPASSILLTFSQVDTEVPSATFGHIQAASTTVAYNSGLYGCGAYQAFSQTAQAITVTDVR